MERGCGSTCPAEAGFYTYEPSVVGNGVLVAVAAIFAAAAFFLGVRLHTAVFSTTLTTGLLLLAVGLLGRVLLNGSLDSQGYLVLSLLGTTLGPACICGALFQALPRILSIYGEHISPIRPLYAGLVLFGLETISAVLQIVGVVAVAYNISDLGAGVSVPISLPQAQADQSSIGQQRTGGTRLTAGGLGVQLLALLLFSGLHFWFTLGLNTRTSRLSSQHASVYRSVEFKRFLFSSELTSALLLAYSAYRIVEMAEGVEGRLFQDEVLFMILDCVIPLLAALILTVFHPGRAFGSSWRVTSMLRSRKSQGLPIPLDAQQRAAALGAHPRYDPNIRKNISPTAQRYKYDVQPPTVARGSPGLPPNPKPIPKGASPVPSPTGTAGTSERASLVRTERASGGTKKLVEKDSLW